LLRSIIICPDQELAQKLEAALGATGEVAAGRTLNRYPNAIDLVRTLRAHAPDVVFLSFESIEKAHEVVKFLHSESEGIQIVAIHRDCDARLLKETMRAGVREFLSDPFDRQAIAEALSQVKALLEKHPPTHDATTQIFAFLPSKAGVGTSTLALNVSAALARRPDTHVLLSDFDLNSGMLRFMLKLQNEYSVIDAVENSLRVDEHLWPQLVTSMDALDVLHAGRINPNIRVESPHIRALVDFMRRNYQALCFDLSGNLERYSLEIMQESKRVLLVCTPEIPSLHQAREKLQFLRNLDLDSRVSVVLNRCQKKGLFTKQQVEELLGVPVLTTFPNDYHCVTRAMTAGTFLDPKSELAKSIEQFAQELVERRTTGQVPDKKKFLEFFAVSGRQSVSAEK
jgi:pilus assembly protein CpaE